MAESDGMAREDEADREGDTDRENLGVPIGTGTLEESTQYDTANGEAAIKIPNSTIGNALVASTTEKFVRYGSGGGGDLGDVSVFGLVAINQLARWHSSNEIKGSNIEIDDSENMINVNNFTLDGIITAGSSSIPLTNTDGYLLHSALEQNAATANQVLAWNDGAGEWQPATLFLGPWDISDDTNLAATSPITLTGDTLSHALSGVGAGTYRSVTVDTLGHVTAGSNPTIDISSDTNLAVTSPIVLTGDTLSHATSGVGAGTYTSVTVNTLGHVTGGTNPSFPTGTGVANALAYWTGASTISSAVDADVDVTIGRVKIGSLSLNIMYLAHYDNHSTVNYALLQNESGATNLNAKSGQNAQICVGGTAQMIVGSALTQSLNNFEPYTDSMYELGSSTKQWSNVWTDRVESNAGNLVIDGSNTVNLQRAGTNYLKCGNTVGYVEVNNAHFSIPSTKFFSVWGNGITYGIDMANDANHHIENLNGYSIKIGMNSTAGRGIVIGVSGGACGWGMETTGQGVQNSHHWFKGTVMTTDFLTITGKTAGTATAHPDLGSTDEFFNITMWNGVCSVITCQDGTTPTRLNMPLFILTGPNGNANVGVQIGSDFLNNPGKLKVESDAGYGYIDFPKITTTQRNTQGGTNGRVIYNTSLNKLQVYAAGAWASLH